MANNPAPVVTSISPTSVTAGDASVQIITITGTGFLATSSVQWNGKTVAATFVSATQLTIAPAATDIASGATVPITVVNPAPGGGTSAPVTLTINNPVASVTALSPAAVMAGAATTTVTVTGTGFVSSSVVQWNGSARTTTYVSATQLTAAVTAADLATAATAQVTVVNPAPGGGNSAAATFTVNNPAPVITATNPASVTAGSAATTATVTGTGFVASSTVNWNGATRTTTFVSATQLQVALTATDFASAASAQLTVVNPSPGGGASAALAFTVNNPAPAITSFSPASLTAGSAATTITVNGTGFVPTSSVQWNGSTRTTTFVNSTQLQVAVTDADLLNGGTVPMTVVNPAPGGGTSAAATLTVGNPVPAVSGATPALYVTDQPTTITVTGTGFVPLSAVQYNGNVRTTTYVSGTQLQATLTAADLASTGTANVTVMNPTPAGGTSTALALPITYAAPTISQLSPAAAAPSATSATLTVYGSGFTPASSVLWNGTGLVSLYVSSSQMRATIPSTDMGIPGTAQITVANPTPGGGASSGMTFTIANYPTPAITAVNPSSALINAGDTVITVSGTNLYSVSTIQVNGTDLSTHVYRSGSALFATLPASYLTALGTLQITVSTPGSGTSNALQFTVTAPAAPTLSFMSPTSAAVGGGDFTLNVTGSNFTSSSVVRWNGSNRPTTYTSSSQLTATIASADIATFTSAQVTVYTPAPGGGTSSALGFVTYLPLANNDIVFNSFDGLLYASVPSSGGPVLGNSVVSIDPNTGVIGTPIFVGSEPNKLALSSDGKTLWVGLDGAAAVRKVDLTTQTAGLQFGLGGGNGLYNSPGTAKALAVMPASPDTVAVASSTGVAVFDAGVARSNRATSTSVTALAFSPTGTSLYAAGSSYAVLTVDSTGITSTSYKNSDYTQTMTYDSGKIYLSSGFVLDADSGNQLAVLSVSQTQQASGPVTVDGVLGRAFMFVNPSYSTYQINAYDTSSYVLAGNIPVGNIGSSYPGVTGLVRWGTDGLAFHTTTQLFVLHSTIVRDLSSTLADLAVNVAAPASAATGSDVAYTIAVTNNGPSDATPATIINTLPKGAVLKTATASQGSCAGTAVLRCDLGTVSNAGTATVTIVATQLTGPSATDTVIVGAPEGDGDLTNNTASATVAMAGSDYTAVPQIISVSPEIVAAGASTFTLTANGSDFATGATVNWNGTALTTTFVSSSQLTAQVPAANVTSLGWAWVSVTNPTPGGGTSGSLPVSTYLTVSLTSNHIHFDPYTQKIYATVPSTATQVTGNSIVAIDPNTGALSTPLSIGSEPNRMAETEDGKYLYVGLDGSKSLTRVDLTSMTQGSIYPLTINENGTPTAIAPRGLAVMPGNDNTLAIDTGSWTGLGVFDISGTTGTFRSTLTGPYTGSTPTFGNASTVYSYDSDTSGALFNHWTVGTNGLTLVNQSTINGIGGFSGSFQLVNGLVYGVGGGVADPATTPATEIGRYMTGNIGLYQSFSPSSLAADPSANRVFFAGSSTAGSALPYLGSFNQSHFTAVDVLQLPGMSLTGTDLQRWGRDGLVFQMAQWPYNTGSNQVVILRGPWVLPEWASSNPVPTVTGSSPSSASAGSGNTLLSVTGSNFVPGAVVLWNGAERSTTYVDSTHLQVAVPASDLTTAGSATLTVTNPGTAASGGVTFTIN